MNYLSEIIAFHDMVSINPLSTGQIALWYTLMYINNKCKWKEWFSVSSQTLVSHTGLSRKAVYNARNALKQKGLIDFKEAGNKKAALYKIISIANTTHDTTLGTTHDTTHDTTQDTTHDTTPLNKLNKTKQNKKIDISSSDEDNISKKDSAAEKTSFDYQSVVDDFNSTCKSLQAVKKLTDSRRRAILSAAKNYDLSAIFAKVEQSDFLSGRNGIWNACCFDWILKPANIIKIYEGNYDNKQQTAKINTGNPWANVHN